MKRALPWIIALAGLLLLTGAMAWATRSLVALERTQQRMAAEATFQERARLALWRMESIAASLLMEESARSPEQYHADSPPPPSPAGRMRLHFELDPSGQIRSPQVESGSLTVPNEPARRLQELRAHLDQEPDRWTRLRQESAAPGAAAPVSSALPPPRPAQGESALRRSSSGRVSPDQAPPALAEAPSALAGELVQKDVALRQKTAALALVGVPQAFSDGKAKTDALLPRLDSPPPLASVSPVPAAAARAAPPVVRLPAAAATITAFRARWVGEALLLTRGVTRDGASWIQGAWIDWPQLRLALLASVADLFPAASLEAAPDSSGGGPDLLASLPLRFRPGRLELPAPPFWSPLKLSLAAAWGCVLVASAAVALVLRGMMALSERRATFVSAVTHELRSPLATFKLYAEMLADGLVRDPAKRQAYLETLSAEADRLGHLVENVLSYSRLERGRAARGRAVITWGELLRRAEPRLHQRAAQAGASLTVSSEGLAEDFSLATDPAAVEQILFNLVDNACKYGRRADAPARLELVLTADKKALRIALRDYGPGLTRAEARPLFRPFHKSARAAAHSSPGVGLGLSLCRRLARDLGGSLEIDYGWPQGACFVLRLPT